MRAAAVQQDDLGWPSAPHDAADVAAGCYGGAGSPWEGYAVAFVEVTVAVPELGASADAVGRADSRGVGVGEHAQVEDGSIGVVHDEVFVAVAAAANGGAETGTDDAL